MRDKVVVFYLALFLRFGWITGMFFRHISPFSLFPDSERYRKISLYIQGKENAEDEMLFSGPGYGAFLALLKNKEYLILRIQAILSAASCVLIMILAEMLFKNRKISLFAGVFSAFSLTSISLSASILTETLFFFLLMLSLVFLRKNYLLSSFFLMLSVFVRPAVIFLPLILVFFLPRWRERIVYLLIFYIPVLLWAGRNKAVHGFFTFSENGIRTASLYLAGEVLGDFGKVEDKGTSWEKHRRDVERVKALFRHPVRTAYFYVKNVILNIFARNELYEDEVKASRKFMTPVFQYLWIAFFFALTIAGIKAGWKEGRRETLFLLSIYLYFALISGISFLQNSRLLFPAEPARVIFAGIAAGRVWRKEEGESFPLYIFCGNLISLIPCFLLQVFSLLSPVMECLWELAFLAGTPVFWIMSLLWRIKNEFHRKCITFSWLILVFFYIYYHISAFEDITGWVVLGYIIYLTPFSVAIMIISYIAGAFLFLLVQGLQKMLFWR